MAPAGWRNRLSAPKEAQQLVRERSKALGIAEKDYIKRQAKTLGVELAQSAKPAQAEKPQAASQSQKDLDPER